MKIEIYDLEQSDIDEVVSLQEIFISESSHYSKLGFNRDKFKNVLSSFLLPCNGCIVAKIDNKIVGYSPYTIDMDFIDKINFEIITFYVHPEYRNTGVGGVMGDRLIELMEDFGSSYSHVSICAQFKEHSELIQKATERLFKKRGFKQIGTVLGRDLTDRENTS
jgi:GNAT superfamily N-acetyltransferase